MNERRASEDRVAEFIHTLCNALEYPEDHNTMNLLYEADGVVDRARLEAEVVRAARAINGRTARSRDYESKHPHDRLLKNYGTDAEFDTLTEALRLLDESRPDREGE